MQPLSASSYSSLSLLCCSRSITNAYYKVSGIESICIEVLTACHVMRLQGYVITPIGVRNAMNKAYVDHVVRKFLFRLVEHGLIEQLPAPGRTKLYAITYKGDQLLNEIVSKLDEVEELCSPRTTIKLKK